MSTDVVAYALLSVGLAFSTPAAELLPTVYSTCKVRLRKTLHAHVNRQ